MCSIKEKYIQCITVVCPNDCSSGSDVCNYSPGCNQTSFDLSLGNCVAFELAKALNLFQFDFYNDWINGSLFSYLLKYKKKGNKEEKFCEYNCNDLAGGGFDGNNNGSADNKCQVSILADTCVGDGNNAQNTTNSSINFNEGLIKKYNNELYYAATTKDTGMKLFATDIISLGSIFECDWQGIPKIQQNLIPTSYKIPPESQENTDSGQIDVSAIVYIHNHNDCGNFFSIDCLGLHTNGRQCLNIRHICEMGVNIDESIYDANNNLISVANCNIGSKDIDDNSGKWFRDVFSKLNTPVLPYIGVNTYNTNILNTDFNINNINDYDFVSTANNGVDYKNFRGYGLNHTTYQNESGFMQPKNSYYFYFGLEPGSTGLDKMNSKFFTPCIKNLRDDIVIESNSTPTTGQLTNGTITFSFIGGVGPFTYTVSGVSTPDGIPFSYSNSGVVTSSSQNITLTNLAAGTYMISGVDNNGIPVTDLITVNGPTPLFCSAFVSSNPTGTTGTGSITITSAGGGNGTLYYNVTNYLGASISSGLLTVPQLINGLTIDPLHGYNVDVYDSSTPIQHCITTGLTISGPSFLNVNIVKTNEHCYGTDTGSFAVTVTGGFTPLAMSVSGMTGPTQSTPFSSPIPTNGIITDLPQGQYGITVTDSHGTSTYINGSTTLISCDNPELKLEKSLVDLYVRQCDLNTYKIPFKLTGLAIGATVNLFISQDNVNWVTYSSVSGVNLINNPDSNGNITINIPKMWITSGIYIKYKYSTPAVPTPLCESNVINYGINSISLPPNALSITESTQLLNENLKQCSPTQAIIHLGISHLDIGNTSRAPYTLDYKIESMSAPTTTIQINNGPFELIGLNSSSPLNNTVNFFMKLTDKRGCVFPDNGTWYQYTATVPTSVLTATKVSTTGTNPNFVHKITASGGIGNKYYNNTLIPAAGLNVSSTSAFFVGVITDSVGCTFNLLA